MSSQQAPKSERTEKPTAKRIRKALEKGNVARSQDVGQAFSLLIFLIWAGFGGALLVEGLRRKIVWTLGELRHAGGADNLAIPHFVGAVESSALLLAPLLLPLLVGALLIQIVQAGINIRKPLFPFEPQKINPITGMKNFISPMKLVQAGKALLKAFIYGALVLSVMIPAWPIVVALSSAETARIASVTSDLVFAMLRRALLVAIVIAIADFAITKRHWYRKLYMTKKEIKDEHRENEGDPKIKGKRRQRQFEMSRQRMFANVPDANVVVTNPTHVAVALRYDQLSMNAPLVVAKGKGHVAARIKAVARDHGVPIVEDPPLARALERLCEIGRPVPEALFRAVAEVLAYVMGRRRGQYRPHDEVESLGREALR